MTSTAELLSPSHLFFLTKFNKVNQDSLVLRSAREKFVKFFFRGHALILSDLLQATQHWQQWGRESETTQLIHVVNFRPFVSQNTTTTMSCDIRVCIRWFTLSTFACIQLLISLDTRQIVIECKQKLFDYYIG